MIRETLSSSFRSDGVNIVIRMSEVHVNRNTLEVVSELPEGADVSDYGRTTKSRVRKDQTGEIFEIAHDVEGSSNTYTEVFPTPESYCDIEFSTVSTGGEYIASVNTNMYPNYSAIKSYAKGDIVVYDGKEWMSDFDDNTGNQPNLYGWSLFSVNVEEREVAYVPLSEL